MKNKINTMTIKQYLLLIIGCLLYSIYASMLLVPNNIGTGGILGISLVINKLFGFKIGIVTMLINIPLFIFGFKLLGKRFAIKSGVIVFLSSYLIDFLPKVMPIPTINDKLTATIFCGVISGISMAFIFMGGGSTGGLDISGKIIKNIFKRVQLSQILLIQDILVYLIVALTLGINYVMYALIMSFIRAKTIEAVQNSFAASKQCIIVCDDSEKIINQIKTKLRRGVTVWDAVGAYSNSKKKFVYVVVQNNEIGELKNIIEQIDQKAFVTVSEVNSIFGNFKEHSLSV